MMLQSANWMLTGRNGLFGGGMMKSTAQRLERQAERDSQVACLENQKKSLKNVECSSPEEAKRLLEMLHSYEDQIAAVKAEYNHAQMFHLLDEAKERGEKIAEAIEKSAPKTAEERKKEAVEEALGIDEEKGVLSDILDKIDEEALAESLEVMVEAETEINLDEEPVQATEVSLDEEPVQAAETSLDEEPVQATKTRLDEEPVQAAETDLDEESIQIAKVLMAEVPTAESDPNQLQVKLLKELAVYKPFDAFA